MSRLRPQEAAELIRAFQQDENQFSMMMKRFEPFVKNEAAKMARSIGSFWFNELKSIGEEALLTAARQFPPEESANKFLGYAFSAIKHAMIDFWRKEDRYQKFVITLPEIKHVSDQTFLSLPQYTSSLSYEPNDRASPSGWVFTATLPIRILYQLDYAGYKRLGLKDRDIKMFEMFLLGYKMWEIGSEFDLTSSYVSRLLCGIRAKIGREYK